MFECCAAALAITLFLSACQSDSVPPTAPPALLVTQDTASAAAEKEQSEFIHTNRFHVEARVSGTLKPGDPVQVTASVRALAESKDVEIRVVLPEVEVARLNGWTALRTPPRGALRAVTHVRKGFAEAEETQNVTVVTIPRAGYYRAVVSATVRSDESPAPAQKGNFQNTVHAEVWFTIDEDGGKVTGAFDPSIMPDNVALTPGPRPSIVDPSVSTLRLDAKDAMSALTSVVNAHTITYYNRDAAAFEGLGQARFEVKVQFIDGSIRSITTGQTSTLGEFTFPCLAQYETAFVNVWYEKPGYVKVIRHGSYGTTAKSFSLPGPLCDTRSYTIDYLANGHEASRVFANALVSIDESRTFFQKSRAEITYKLSTIVPDTYYSRTDDRIQIDTGATWGAYGIFSVAHEYGHALHHIVLGGIKTGAGTCAYHEVTGYYNLGCGYTEGFADYHAAATRGASGEFFTLFRDGWYQSGRDGAINESAVAAFLYDLTDAANDEVFDTIQYPGSYVAETYRTCDVYRDFLHPWDRANGMDHMVYCFEQIVDPAVKNTYFWSRSSSSRPSNQREFTSEPAGWNRNAIRSVWKYNLYRQ